MEQRLAAMVSVCLLMTAGVQARDLSTAQAVLACAAGNAPAESFSLVAHFDTSQEPAARVGITTRIYGIYDERSLTLNLMIREPSNLQGTAFYVREQAEQDDMRIFVPALQRSRRVTGSMAARELWGTSFSYIDIKQMFGAFVSGDKSLLPDTRHMDRPVKSVSITPDPREGAPFEQVEVLIDQATCVPLTADYHDADGNALKRLRASPDSLAEMNGHHFATRITMTDLLAGKETTVTLDDIHYDERIPRSAFSPNSYHRVR